MGPESRNRRPITFGAPHRHFRLTDSTNARARELAEAGAPHGTVVTAGEQTEGRGRQGRTWTAPPGKALLYSAVLRPLAACPLLPLAVPLAVCETAEELRPGIECAIKWPNDVLVEDRKLAGVLIEAKPRESWAAIGVGLNLTISLSEFPPDLRDTAISLFDSSAKERGGSDGASRSGRRRVTHPPRSGIDVSPPRAVVGSGGPPPSLLIAAAVLSHRLDHWVEADRATILAAWRARDALRGREVAWDGGTGVAAGIDDSGDLLVVAAGGDRVPLTAGEVHLRL
jgi:BirA family transcriptional regulator, biotin operon repressor / biotin---[acetyl-CoA-carboxylase] ligase